MRKSATTQYDAQPPAQRGTVLEIQRATLINVVLAEGMKLHHQGTGQYLQGKHVQHWTSLKEAGMGWLHSPQSPAGQQGQDVDVEHVICGTPPLSDTGQPCENEPDTVCPDTENLNMDNPCLENQP